MLCSLCMLLMLTMASPIHSANIPGRTHCPEGYILWPVDSTCHQGPCGDNQVLRDHQQGPYCDYIEDNNDNDNDNNDTETEEVKENVDYNPDKEVSAWSLGTVIEHPPGAVKVRRKNLTDMKYFSCWGDCLKSYESCFFSTLFIL